MKHCPRMDHYDQPRRIFPKSATVANPGTEVVHAEYADVAVQRVIDAYPGCKILEMAEPRTNVWIIRYI